MTFFEAAVEVLRRAGRPLHYKKITEIAVRDNLLSHVGKSPQDTMNSRLEREIQKSNGSVLDRTRPGVYKLDKEHAKELTEKVRKQQEKERKRREAREKKQQEQKRKREERRKQEEKEQKQKKQRDKQQNQQKQKKKKKQKRSDSDGDQKRRRARGSQTEHTKKKRDRSDQDGQTGRKKRKRTRRGQKDGQDEQKQQKKQKKQTKQKKEKSNGKKRRRRRSKKDRNKGKSGDDSGQRRKRGAAPPLDKTAHLDQGPVQLKGIAKAAHKVLDENRDEPVHIEDLADDIFDRKLVKFHTHDPVTTVKSALANDNQIREQRGHRPLFDHDMEDYWWLTEWDLADRVYEREQTVLSLTEEIRQDTVDQLGQALLSVKTEALEHLALTLLERLGYHNIKVSKRSSDGDVFFTADWRQGLADVRVCVRVVSDHDRNLDADAVSDLRETLDHYSASEGVIIHLGAVTDAAVNRSRKDGQAPITLLDDETFVELLIKHGIGVQVFNSPIVTVDTNFIDALKS